VRPWIPLLALTLAGLAIVVVLASSDDDDGNTPPPPPTPVQTKDEPNAPAARAAEVDRGGVSAIHVSWGDRSALIADLGGQRRVSLAFKHRYPRPRTFRISTITEASTGECPLKESQPATLRVRVPLR
jgi:hypothetical protein